MSAARPERGVLLIGQGPTAASALESLTAQVQVVGLVRSRTSGPDPALELAEHLGLAVQAETGLRPVLAFVERLDPALVVICSYDRIIPAEALARRPYLNVHYAPLPRYRGRAPVNWALINGEAETALTIHEVVPELDAGPILFQESLPIGPLETVTDLYGRLETIQRRHLGRVTAEFLAGRRGQAQDESQATYGCGRNPEDGEIDWAASTTAAHNLIRALTPPFPGAFTYYQGRKLLIRQARPAPAGPPFQGRIPGRVAAIDKAAGAVEVLTGDGRLRVEEVQWPGQPAQPAAQVITSVRHGLGLGRAELLGRIEALETRLAGREEKAS